MFVRVFQYTVAPDKLTAFEQAYGDEGEWVRLFSTAKGYLGSTLERGAANAYRTQDLWDSSADFTRFLATNQQAYDAIDRQYASLKLTEEHCGHFTEPQPAGADWQLIR